MCVCVCVEERERTSYGQDAGDLRDDDRWNKVATYL